MDEKTIDALYRASQAGVKIDIVERGICALKPGVPGLSENIRVRSILGRFWSTAASTPSATPTAADRRRPGLRPQVWIGSADLMHRNLDRRVEVLVRITTDPDQINELISYVDLQMADSTASWGYRSRTAPTSASSLP